MEKQMQFFKETIPQLLDQLTPDTEPKWGILNPQAMLEHLVSSWRIANGKAEVSQAIPDDQLPQYRDFLFSDQPFEPETKNPVMPENESPALRKPDLEAAKQQLKQEIKDFFDYHASNPNAKPIHPIFGPLDKSGWLQFQEKHMTHHLNQFGLLPE